MDVEAYFIILSRNNLKASWYINCLNAMNGPTNSSHARFASDNAFKSVIRKIGVDQCVNYTRYTL